MVSITIYPLYSCGKRPLHPLSGRLGRIQRLVDITVKRLVSAHVADVTPNREASACTNWCYINRTARDCLQVDICTDLTTSY